MKAATTSSDAGSSASLQARAAGPHANRKESPFDVPSLLHFLGGLVHRHRDFWLWLGRLESSLVAEPLRQVSIRRPIYVCGLARSGSTLLHEFVCSHPCVASHRIKDYPMVFTPYWWRRATANLRPKAPHERPHRDRVMVTTESPDAIEEMLWIAFFPSCHDPSVSNLLGAGDSHPAFESFYRAHIRKVLLAERSERTSEKGVWNSKITVPDIVFGPATRYCAKANYHVARLPYLVRLFPDARFLIPVRSPAGHIASLMRQQQLFSEGQRKHPRALTFMQRSGHFEFGLDRRPMHLGDSERTQQIVQAWAAGDEVRGQAMHWDMVYGYLARLLASDAPVRAAALVVRFETICDAPVETLRAVLGHCLLPDVQSIVERHAPRIRYPVYYPSDFSAEDLAVIRQETAGTASLWGY